MLNVYILKLNIASDVHERDAKSQININNL